MKNGLFSTISSEKHRGAGHVNQLKQHQKLVFVKRRFCYQFGGITKELSILNSYHPTEHQFCCRTTNEIKQCSWRKAARIDKSKRCCIPSWRCKATHIFGHSAKIIGTWSRWFLPHPPYSPDLAPSDYFLFRSLQKDFLRTWFSFLLIKTTSFMNVGLWCCLKDGKRSLIKMGNTLRNKVI